MGYTKEAIKGVSWVSAFRYATRGVAFIRTIILARILTPRQFGVFGIVSFALSFLEIITETGINVFLIQKKENYKHYLDTAWVVSILRGVSIAVVLFLLASPLSAFFNSPESLRLLQLVALVPLIRGFVNPAIVSLQKDLQFQKEFWFRSLIFLFDTAIAIVVTSITKSPIGFVVGLISGALLELVLSYIFIKPWPKFRPRVVYFIEVVSVGKWLTGAGIFQFLFREGDDAIVGKVLGEYSLGLYQVAYKISTLPISEVTDVFNRVALPIYVKISTNKKRLMRAFLVNTTIVTTLAFVLGVFIFVFAEDLVLFALGPSWVEAIPLMRVLAVFGIIQAIVASVHSLLLALNKQKYVTLITGVAIIGLIASIFPLIYQFGLKGAIFAPLIGSLLSFPFMLFALQRALKELHE
jgi:O-antigen/teichoic acid export membrane protein